MILPTNTQSTKRHPRIELCSFVFARYLVIIDIPVPAGHPSIDGNPAIPPLATPPQERVQ